MPHPALLTRPGYADLIRNTTGLLGYWRMNDRSGSVVRAAKGNDGTYVASPVLGLGTPLRDGVAAKFNGTTQAASASADLSGYAQASISFWLWTDSYASADALAFEYGTTFTGGVGFLVDPDSGSPAAGNVQIAIGTGALAWRDSFTRPSAATWHHWLLTFDRATPVNTAYIDGVSQALTAVGHGAGAYGNFANNSLYFMSRATTSLFAPGRISDVALFGGVLLTGNQAREQYAEGVG